MATEEYPEEFLAMLRAVVGKRPRAVIEHILEHGSVTTEELSGMGYNHPPRAARDVRELGIPLVTTRVVGSDGRRIGAYKLGKPDELVAGLTGRTAISKKFKKKLISEQGQKCAACGHTFEGRYLQVDHRVPVEVGGDEPDGDRTVARYMLLDGGCNRAKSWSCENCPNFKTRDPATCETCYWACPEGRYDHVGTVAQRRVEVVWSADEIVDFSTLASEAEVLGIGVSDYIKRRLSC